MAGLKDTKRRIASVKNTQKITRAMKLVSSAKYARAHANTVKARPFSKAIEEIVEKMGPYLEQFSDELGVFRERPEQKSLLVVITTDRGLCGALNTNILRLCHNFLEEKRKEGVSSELRLLGRKSHLLKKKRSEKILSFDQKVLEKPSYHFCKEETENIVNEFSKGRWDRVYVAFTKFKNTISQQATIEPFLPLPLNTNKEGFNYNILIEPLNVSMVEAILATQVANLLFRILLEGATSEHAARMTAMDSATSNADKVIKDLTLEYNRGRQASITKELIEITSGAEAL